MLAKFANFYFPLYFKTYRSVLLFVSPCSLPGGMRFAAVRLDQRLNFGPANGEFRRPNMSVLASIRRVTISNFHKSKNYSKTKVYKSQLSPTYHLY